MNVFDEATRSLWMGVDVAPDARALTSDSDADVVIVGSGIAGLSIAYELTSIGRSVIVLDRGAIGSGMTARTTAHLVPVCDDLLSELIGRRGEETARLFQESQAAAVDRIGEIVAAHDIACNFRRLDGCLFPALGTEPDEARKQLETEYEAAGKAGAKVEWAKGLPFDGLESIRYLRYPEQGTFHPQKYLRGLAAAIVQQGGRLYANTAVTGVEQKEGGVVVTTSTGKTVKARHAVVATNSPINDRVTIHDKQAPYRTYAMAFTVPSGSLPDELWWDMADPYHYVRLNPGPGTADYLIAGGADHKSGTADDGGIRFEAIEAWIRNLVPNLGKEVSRWSGQVMDTVDFCGFVGRNPGDDDIFIVTGDSGQGMTHGAMAGLLIRDLIVGAGSRWEDVYDPARKTPRGVTTFISENATMIKNMALSLVPGGDAPAAPAAPSSADDLKPGEGAVIARGSAKIAAYRDENGRLHERSACCTHLGCELSWNSTEKCWDCNCHGSQFSAQGAVLNGPAIHDLEPADKAGDKDKEKGRPRKETTSG